MQNSHMEIALHGLTLAENGNHRGAADAYRNAYQKNDRYFPSWSLCLLSLYTDIFGGKLCTARTEDIAFLGDIFRDRERNSATCRALAGYTLGLVHQDAANWEKCVKWYRRVLKMELTGRERTRRVADQISWGWASGKVVTTEGDLFDTWLSHANNLLVSVLDGGSSGACRLVWHECNPMDNSSIDPETLGNPQIYTRSLQADVAHRYVIEALRVPGFGCDQCGETMDDCRRHRCSQCKRLWYCSARCQKLHWRLQHRLSCRHPGCFEPRDIVRLHSIQTYPKLNGCLVEVLRPAQVPGRFAVAMIGETVGISVHKDKMTLIIPVAEREDR